MDSNVRTVVNFYTSDRSPIRTVQLSKTIPNVVVGQIMAFDHSQLAKCLTGKIYNIQHAVYLSEKTDPPVTYIDVECE